MTEQEKLDFIKTALHELFSKEVTLTKDLKLIDDLNLDSLDIVEIQLYYEDVTKNILPDIEYQLITIGDLLKIMP